LTCFGFVAASASSLLREFVLNESLLLARKEVMSLSEICNERSNGAKRVRMRGASKASAEMVVSYSGGRYIAVASLQPSVLRSSLPLTSTTSLLLFASEELLLSELSLALERRLMTSLSSTLEEVFEDVEVGLFDFPRFFLSFDDDDTVSVSSLLLLKWGVSDPLLLFWDLVEALVAVIAVAPAELSKVWIMAR